MQHRKALPRCFFFIFQSQSQDSPHGHCRLNTGQDIVYVPRLALEQRDICLNEHVCMPEVVARPEQRRLQLTTSHIAHIASSLGANSRAGLICECPPGCRRRRRICRMSASLPRTPETPREPVRRILKTRQMRKRRRSPRQDLVNKAGYHPALLFFGAQEGG